MVLLRRDEFEALVVAISQFTQPEKAIHLKESLAQLERGEVKSISY